MPRQSEPVPFLVRAGILAGILMATIERNEPVRPPINKMPRINTTREHIDGLVADITQWIEDNRQRGNSRGADELMAERAWLRNVDVR
jgi:hypothetical protein